MFTVNKDFVLKVREKLTEEILRLQKEVALGSSCEEELHRVYEQTTSPERCFSYSSYERSFDAREKALDKWSDWNDLRTDMEDLSDICDELATCDELQAKRIIHELNLDFPELNLLENLEKYNCIK